MVLLLRPAPHPLHAPHFAQLSLQCAPAQAEKFRRFRAIVRDGQVLLEEASPRLVASADPDAMAV